MGGVKRRAHIDSRLHDIIAYRRDTYIGLYVAA